MDTVAITAGNGEQQGFDTGATRSASEGKIDFEGHINPFVEHVYGKYMNEHRVQRDGKLRASDNWQLGIPIPNYMKSLVRHMNELRCMYRGTTMINSDNGEVFKLRDVLCALRFNIDGLMLELIKDAKLDYAALPESVRVGYEKKAGIAQEGA
jgi:hypothetical protein